jgi:hypothetical protein
MAAVEAVRAELAANERELRRWDGRRRIANKKRGTTRGQKRRPKINRYNPNFPDYRAVHTPFAMTPGALGLLALGKR